MTMRRLLVIDPGASGGIAWIDRDHIVRTEPMPDGMTAVCDRIRALGLHELITQAVVEKVGMHRVGNNASASCKFARHAGHIEAALYCLGIPTEQVAPGVWMRHLGTLPKDKGDRKRAIRDEMQRRHPHLKVTLKTADALGILSWAMRRGDA